MIVAAVAAATLSCTWAKPGADPYMGSIPAAVERYADIPPAARAALRRKMERREYDDIAVIERDRIEGPGGKYGELRDMHFGAGRLCREVDRSMWAVGHEERGLVYCADGHCLIVPTVCRNVSRITRLPDVPAVDDILAAPPGAGPAAVPAEASAPAQPGMTAPGVVALPWWPEAVVPFVPGTRRPWAPQTPGADEPGRPGVVPEPGTLALVLAGLLAALKMGRRR